MTRHVPVRTCTGCQKSRPKRELLRVVRTPTGEIEVDRTGKKAGRGAYVCPGAACVEASLRRGGLERVLGQKLPPAAVSRLREEVCGRDGGGGDGAPRGPE